MAPKCINNISWLLTGKFNIAKKLILSKLIIASVESQWKLQLCFVKPGKMILKCLQKCGIHGVVLVQRWKK